MKNSDNNELYRIISITDKSHAPALKIGLKFFLLNCVHIIVIFPTVTFVKIKNN